MSRGSRRRSGRTRAAGTSVCERRTYQPLGTTGAGRSRSSPSQPTVRSARKQSSASNLPGSCRDQLQRRAGRRWDAHSIECAAPHRGPGVLVPRPTGVGGVGKGNAERQALLRSLTRFGAFSRRKFRRQGGRPRPVGTGSAPRRVGGGLAIGWRGGTCGAHKPLKSPPRPVVVSPPEPPSLSRAAPAKPSRAWRVGRSGTVVRREVPTAPHGARQFHSLL